MNIPELLAQYETRLLKDKLLEFPGMIRKQKADLRNARGVYNDAAQEEAMIEADLAANIAAENNPNTLKPMFSNDKARQAELMRRKMASEGYRAAAATARTAEYRMNELQDGLEALQDKFKAYRYVVRLTAEELALFASEENEEAVEGVPVTKQMY